MRYFSFSGLLTLAVIVGVGLTLGVGAALTTLVLIAIEIAFSFDNAIVNAKVLERLSPLWRQVFMTVGVLIAIVGMRAVFPVLIVMVSAHLPWHEVINEALHHPTAYSQHLAGAQTAIAAFGGSFLLTLALYFLLDDDREELWLKRLERPLQKFGGPRLLPPFLAAVTLVVISLFAQPHHQVLKLGLIGAVGYASLKLLIDGLAKLEPQKHQLYSGWPALLAFLYLEVLDASFSFDGVLGAFAITNRVILIVLGLGVGALWVRSLTVFMVKRGTLRAYIYLEHGAHYAILILAVALLSSIFIHVPDAVTGLIGLGVIAASFNTSRQLIKDQQQR